MEKRPLCYRTKKSRLKYRRLPSHLKAPQSLRFPLDLHPHQLTTATVPPFLRAEIGMITNVDTRAQHTELAIRSINLNAESQAQGKQSSLTYYRLFYLGKPVSEFSCKACHKGLGHMPPVKCGRCCPFADGLGTLERTILGYSQMADGITVGEYLVSRVEGHG